MMGECSEGVTTPFEWNSESSDIEEDLKIDRCEFFGDRPEEASFTDNALVFPTPIVSETASDKSNSKRSSNKKVDVKRASRVSRRKKKPNGLPKRPLSAYNVFFQQERLILQKEENSTIGFEEFGKLIGARWKRLGEEERREYVEAARQDNLRYRTEMDAYKAPCEEKRKLEEKSDEADKKDPGEDVFSPDPWTPASSLQESQDLTGGAPSNGASFLGLNKYSPESNQYYEPRNYTQQLQGPPPPPRHMHWSPPQGSFRSVASHPPPPPPPPRLDHFGQMRRDEFPVPPGMEVMLPDASGRERKYTVAYNVYTMTREAADRYIHSFTPAGGGYRAQGMQRPLMHDTQALDHCERSMPQGHSPLQPPMSPQRPPHGMVPRQQPTNEQQSMPPPLHHSPMGGQGRPLRTPGSYPPPPPPYWR